MGARRVPHDLEAEAALLGAVLLDNNVLASVIPMLSADDFYSAAHQEIYRAMEALHRRNEAVDHVTVSGQLVTVGSLERAGGIAKLGTLTDLALPSSAMSYARRIVVCATKRRIIIAANQIADKGMATTADADDLEAYANEARLLLARACDYAHPADDPVHIAAELSTVFNTVFESKGVDKVVRTGMPQLDKLSGGLMPGLLTVVAARPGMGKSAFVQNVATNAALAGKRVLFISLEDTTFFMGVRQIARFAGVDNTLLSTRQASSADRQRVNDTITTAGDMPLWIYSGAGMTSERLRNVVLRHREKHGLDFLVVDHLAEIRDEAESETHVVSRAAEAARNLAKDLNIPGLYAHQLNRRVEDRPDKRPNLSDLKQSGKVEEVARAVWLLYRPGYYSKQEDRRDLQLIIGKTNHGVCTVVRLWADFSNMYMRDWDSTIDGPFPVDAETGDRAGRREWRGGSKRSADKGPPSEDGADQKTLSWFEVFDGKADHEYD